MAFDVLELDGIPRERGKLQARINEARHQRRAARRRRNIKIVLAVVLAVLAIVYRESLLAMVAAWNLWDYVALAAGVVLTGSILRLIYRVSQARKQVAMEAKSNEA